MVLKKCQKYRRERRCSKDGWPKHKNERKRPIHSKFWPKPLWLSMVLDWGLPAQISRNLEKILSFVNFLCNLQVLAIWNAALQARLFWRTARNFENLAFLERACKEKNYQYLVEAWFWDLSLQKLKIHKKKMTFCPLFELQKVTLGEMVFEGAKQLQIQKFHLGWKVDRPSFPMNHISPDLD